MSARAMFVRAMLGSLLLASAVFRPSVTPADGASATLPPASGGHYDYPASARRLGQQGRFLVELSITHEGRVTNIALLAADSQGVFDHSLIVNLGKLRFSVPRDWGTTGGPARRFKVNILFLVRPCRETGPCVELGPLTSDPIITFTGPPIGT
jgi:TonB family protein